MGRNRLVLSLLAAAMVVAIAFRQFISQNPAASRPADAEAIGQKLAAAANSAGTGWTHGDFAVAARDEMEGVPGLSECVAWNEFTREYVLSLARRRADIIAWTRSSSRPSIRVVFLGSLHVTGRMESIDDVFRSQAAIVESVAAMSGRANVVSIEMSGADGPLTWDRYMDAAISATAKYDGILLNRPEIEPNMIAHPEISADITFLRSPGFPAVIFGEEPTLHHLHAWMIGHDGDYARYAAFPVLYGVIRAMRTEFAVVRTLEYLRSYGGDTAIIVQGYAHADDFPDIEPHYSVDFDVRIPYKPIER